jgi:glutathione S-transferase
MDYFRPEAEAALTFVDQALEGRDWLVGDAFSIADIGCWSRMVFMAEGGLEITRWPNIVRWSDAIKAMPGYGFPYDLTPKKDRTFEGR